MTGDREPGNRGNLARNVVRKPGLRLQRVEAAERPGVVAAIECPHEVHHVLVRRDVVAAVLEVDRVVDERGAADGDDTRLDEREGEAVARTGPWRRPRIVRATG